MADQPFWNPSDKDADVTLSNSDRTWSVNSGNTGSVRSTAALSAGKWRVQTLHVTSAGSANRHGFATSSFSVASAPGNGTTSWAINGQGDSVTNGVVVDLGGNYANGGIVNLYIDIDAGKIWYGNSSGPFSGDPAAGTGAHHTFTGGTTIYLADGMDGGGSTRGGTLQLLASYSGTPPTGFTDGWGGGGSTTFNQSLSATLTATATIRKSVQKRLSATLTATVTIRKTVQKRLSAALPMAATLARIALRPVALVAGMAMTASMRRQVHKGLSATLTATGTIVKTVHKALSAACTLTGSIAKAFPVHLVASLTATASMTRTIYKFLSGPLPMTGVLGKIKAVVVNMSASLGMTAAMRASTLFIRSLSASITLSATVQRTISKMLSAPLPVIARPIAWVASMFAATRHDKPNWNQCARCWRKQRPNKMQQQMEYRGPRLVWTGLYVCHSCLDDPQPQEIWPRETGGDPKPVILARPRRD